MVRAILFLLSFWATAPAACAFYSEDVREEVDIGVDGSWHDVTQCCATEERFEEHPNDDGTESNAEDPGGSETASREEESTADDHESGENVSPQHAEGGQGAKAHGDETTKFLDSSIVCKANEEGGEAKCHADDQTGNTF